MADFFRNGLDGRWGMGMGKTIISGIGRMVCDIMNNLNIANIDWVWAWVRPSSLVLVELSLIS